jgi:hypothetical protein
MGALWLAGGAMWLAVGATGGGQHGWRFDAQEALWIMADLLLLAGLLGLRQLRPYGGSRLGDVGMGIAIAGRLVFIAAEVLSLVQHTDENPLLPLGAVLSAIGMVALGVAVARAGVWTGISRFGPLAMGLYPFVVMFPLLAASGGSPPLAAIACWGLGAVVVGASVLAQARGSAGARAANFAAN